MSRTLTQQEISRVRGLVTAKCANYDKEYKCCPLLDDYGCYMLSVRFSDSGLCRYFHDAVLPLSRELGAVFAGLHTIAEMRKCAVCGASFPKAGRRKYCSESCAALANQLANARRVTTHRRNRGEM